MPTFQLLQDLGISIADAQGLIGATQAPRTVPMSQSAASLAGANVLKCKWSPVNKVLGGGLPRSHVLEISGPPGSFKELLACDFVRSFVELEAEVVFAGDELPNYLWMITKHLCGRHAKHDQSACPFETTGK